MAISDLAVTVLELEPNEFHWILMEAVQAESEDCLGYKPVDSSTRGYPDYSEALVQGALAVRAAQGLAVFGQGWHPEGLVARAGQTTNASSVTNLGPATGRTTSRDMAANAETVLAPEEGVPSSYLSGPHIDGAPDTCMFTTMNSVL